MRLARRPARFDATPVAQFAAGSPAHGEPEAIAVGSGRTALQRSPQIGAPGDTHEREADRIADAVVGQGATAVGAAITPLVQRQAEDEEELQTKSAGGSPAATGGALAQAANAVASGGRPLSGAERGYFEPRLGRDLSPVRLHDDAAAGAAAKGVGARAYTLGEHIAFAAGQYDGASSSGRHLLAHELVHTAQQGRTNALRRAPEGDGQNAPVALNEVFPFEEGRRVQITRGEDLTSDIVDLLKEHLPDVAALLPKIEGTPLTVTTLDADAIEFLRAGEITLPAIGETPSKTLKDVRLKLVRDKGDTFFLTMTAAGSGSLADPLSVAIKRGAAGFEISSSGAKLGTVSKGSGGGASLEVEPPGIISALGEKARDAIPWWAEPLIPDKLTLLDLTALPDAKPGSSEEKAAIEKNAEAAKSATRSKRQKFTAGVGVAVSQAQPKFFLESSWQINFQPIDAAGAVFRVPLRASLQYIPSSSVLGKVTSGAGLSLSAIKIPVNIEVIGGVGAGSLANEDFSADLGAPRRAAAGPILGGSVGLEYRRLRVDLRYEHLWNLVSKSPNAQSLGLTVGASF